ncbi:hypothetical protein EET67_21310 [Pseudaminobacter arsenicus]|uniref:Lipoprotein n=1 Tax=Borborobacter arsenicus TaxID=1851146 RepID=A0A432V0X4_9HYPH|nr:hypothetical protein [Pseudaminobacter arsenicus]RUM95748.1 hypothetical protein EET67_21310 [Pseudaminobacter arsenicus]
MSGLVRTMLTGFACCGLLGAAGCTKTSDGSIEFQRQYMMPGLFGIQPKQAASSVPAAFPPPPAPPEQKIVVRKKPPTRTVRRKTPPAALAQAKSEPARPLICQNETQSGGRVKFVCR